MFLPALLNADDSVLKSELAQIEAHFVESHHFSLTGVGVLSYHSTSFMGAPAKECFLVEHSLDGDKELDFYDQKEKLIKIKGLSFEVIEGHSLNPAAIIKANPLSPSSVPLEDSELFYNINLDLSGQHESLNLMSSTISYEPLISKIRAAPEDALMFWFDALFPAIYSFESFRSYEANLYEKKDILIFLERVKNFFPLKHHLFYDRKSYKIKNIVIFNKFDDLLISIRLSEFVSGSAAEKEIEKAFQDIKDNPTKITMSDLISFVAEGE